MLISVVVSTFNHGRFIANALDSVLRQQVDFEVEIIVGDDASQDDTRDILRAYERANPDRIRLFLPPANLGGEGGALFLALMGEARGDFIAILDGDDEWTDPEKLRKQAAFLLRHPECLLSFHNALVVYEDDKRPAHPLRTDSDDCLFDVGQMLKLTTVQNSTLMLRRELLDPQRGWLDGLTLFEISDWTIAVLAAKFGPVAYLGETLSLYRQHAGGWWSLSRRNEQLAVTITQYEWLRSHLPAAHAPIIRLQIAQHALEMSREFERRGDFRGAALALSRCLAERPPEFEHYLPNEGPFGKTVWWKLALRAALYRFVGVNHLTWRLRPLAGDLRWEWARWREGRRAKRRQAGGQSVGWIHLRPEAVDSQVHGALRSVELHWAPAVPAKSSSRLAPQAVRSSAGPPRTSRDLPN
jgi:glycosyltransferase involved in cell wall biosynthesis